MIPLITFFIKISIRSRRMFWISLLGLFPVGITLLLLFINPLLSEKSLDFPALFPQINFFLYLHFLLPLMAVFMGSGIIADEVEGLTLPFLLVRPIPRWQLVLAKAISSGVTLGVVLFVSLFFTYSLLFFGQGFSGWLNDLGIMFQSAAVLILGLWVYMSLFGFLGGVLKRSVLSGLLFTFGWENLVAYFPGNVKLLTIVHYLHCIFPTVQSPQSHGLISQLFISVKKTSPGVSIFVLIGLCIFFLFLLLSLLYVKEYRLQRE